MIIEFIGTPGSGKTTLIPVATEIFATHDYTARTIVEASRPVASRTAIGKGINWFVPAFTRDALLWQVFYRWSYLSQRQFIKENPDLVSQVRISQHTREIDSFEREHSLYWWFQMIGYYRFLQPRLLPQEVLIMDEGFTHRVVQLHASDSEIIDRENLTTYLHLIPRPDILIFVDSPAEICEERVYKRGLWTRFQHKSRNQISQYISNSHLVVNLAIDVLKSFEWRIIKVDNSAETVLHAEQELNQKLSQMLENKHH